MLFADDQSIVAARVNGVLRDLTYVIEDGDTVEPIAIDSPEGRAILRHSTAHVLAQAVQDLFPKAKLGIGPPIDNGFYYDFDVPQPFHPDDLQRIEKRMREIVKEGQGFSRREVTDEEARAELADEPYKLELIGLKGAAGTEGVDVEVGGEQLTIYDNLHPDGSLAWKDLCRGPHLPTTRRIPAFRLMRSAGAYWRGSEQNPSRSASTAPPGNRAMRSRTIWPFSRRPRSATTARSARSSTCSRSLMNWLRPRGLPSQGRHHPAGDGELLAASARGGRLLLRQLTAHHQGRPVPDLRHLQWFADGMFPPMEMEGSRYYLKLMNCPFHILIYRSRGRSYRELPLRLFEFGTVYRYEKSGVVHGLTRVRGLTMDDAHIFCTKEQMGQELRDLLRFVLDLLRDYGLTDFFLELSTRDESEKFVGADADWEEATAALRAAAESSGLDLVPDPGGAAFYGPKISVQARDAIGRTWQMSTIQVDFQFPQRFDLEHLPPMVPANVRS